MGGLNDYELEAYSRDGYRVASIVIAAPEGVVRHLAHHWWVMLVQSDDDHWRAARALHLSVWGFPPHAVWQSETDVIGWKELTSK